ncbi:unnamed protein product [Linum tenue]|uniref:Aminotransferase-like plant mobile domain-containing protein n=1 Tax=Linum tenue TaxID=586396 RepID=A0AAV0P231_9ROSI|nr:unnamed protein product [Linum tenue]
MVPDRIAMSRGGEALQEVIGRDEEDEMPIFQDGAFQILGSSEGKARRWKKRRKLVDEGFLGEYLPEGEIERHTMRQLVGSIQMVDATEFQCDQWIEEPTLLVTRFEYANLFHTVTDWYSSYAASKVTELPYRPHLVSWMAIVEHPWKKPGVLSSLASNMLKTLRAQCVTAMLYLFLWDMRLPSSRVYLKIYSVMELLGKNFG